MAIKKWLKNINNRGNIAIIVAVSLTVLIGMLALVVDGGYLFASKDKYQNGVEAAAMAGALHFTDDPLTVAVSVALENGIPSGAVAAEIGFYDEAAADFTADPDSSTSWNEEISTEEEPIYNNSVMVTADDNVQTFLAGIFGRDTVQVSAKAVAYGKRYTFLATGDTGIDLDCCWYEGYNVYRNCVIGSNGPVSFGGEEYETFEGTWVEAMGEVTGADGKVDVIELTKELEAPEIDWDGLRAQAEDHGVVYTQAVLESWPSEWATDAFGNNYRRVGSSVYGVTTINYCFVPAGRDEGFPEWGVPPDPTFEGDHEGRTYFFEIPDEPPTGVDSYILRVFNNDSGDCPPGRRIGWNFTLAARCGFSSYPLPAYGPYYNRTTMGNIPEYGDDGIVHIYCKECTGYSKNWYTRYATMKMTEPNGVIFHTEGDFEMTMQGSTGTFFFRLYADSIRIFNASFGRKSSIIFEGAFGPLDCVKLGKLVPAGG